MHASSTQLSSLLPSGKNDAMHGAQAATLDHEMRVTPRNWGAGRGGGAVTKLLLLLLLRRSSRVQLCATP